MNQLYYEIDRKMELVRQYLDENVEGQLDEFYERLDFSWIYHDNALEGVVLSFHELNSAIDPDIISDASLIPAYDEISNHKEAIGYVRMTGAKKKPAINLDYLKRLYTMLSQEGGVSKDKGKAAGQYRKDNPLHRLYFHEIAPPEKISYQMRKLMQWMTSDEAKKMHPVRRASVAHHKLIGIYPWPKHSGKIARLTMNAMLLRDGLLPSVIHAIERQRYYEVLRQPPEGLTRLVGESLVSTLDAAARFLEEEVRAAS
ncbi:MAG: Fic family protein [Myxococcales bacterium]|nr:Fic family protein [Myxococcales bacterium]